MNMVDVIQRLVAAKKAKIYLEIGVCAGTCFLQIKAPRKIGIDVKFCISGRKKILKHYLRNLGSNIFNRYYQMKSDDFFRKNNSLFEKRKIDIAFIDGLHEYHQVVRDANNCLNSLSEGGVIILHDCNPHSEKAALPFERISGKIYRGWQGDVWKAVVYFRSCRPDLNIFVLDVDCGLGVLTRGKPVNALKYTTGDIENLSYHDLERNRDEMLNLKSSAYFEEFLIKTAPFFGQSAGGVEHE